MRSNRKAPITIPAIFNVFFMSRLLFIVGNWGLFSKDGCHYPTASSIVAELAQVDALPGAQIQASAADGDGEAWPDDARLGMGGHVVSAFERVFVVGLTFLHQVVEDGLHVGAYVGVGIFVDAQRSTGMLDEEVQQSRLRQGWKLAKHFFGDEVETS